MKRTVQGLLVLVALSIVVPRQAAAKSDIQVKLILPNGKTITYGSEVRTVELLLGANGMVEVIHLILAKRSREKDTHEWYNFSALVGFSYTYLAVTGRAKVRLKRILPIGVIEPPKEKVPTVRPKDYR